MVQSPLLYNIAQHVELVITSTHFDHEKFSSTINVIDEKQEKDRFPFSIDPRVVTSPFTCYDSRELLAMKKKIPPHKTTSNEKRYRNIAKT